jgi:tetratricopeptide (TPR) repeat protein
MSRFALILLLAVPAAAQAVDDQIQNEFQDLMSLLGPPARGETVDEEAAKARVETFDRRIRDFLSRWELRHESLREGRLVLGKALALAGRAADAVPHFERFLREHADSRDCEEALLSLGSAHLDLGRTAAAAAVFERFLAERKESDRRPVASFYLAVAREREGRLDEALVHFASVRSGGGESPLVADAALKSVEVLRRLGRIEEAKAELGRLLAEDEEAPYLRALKEQLDALGTPAPPWTDIDSWVQGGPLDLAALRGRVVVLNFFADRYEACQDELKRLDGLARSFPAEEVVFVGLTKYYRPEGTTPRAAEQAILRELLGRLGVGFPVAVAGSVANLHAYTVRGVPHTLVIGKSGLIEHVQAGATRHHPQALAELSDRIGAARTR